MKIKSNATSNLTSNLNPDEEKTPFEENKIINNEINSLPEGGR